MRSRGPRRQPSRPRRPAPPGQRQRPGQRRPAVWPWLAGGLGVLLAIGLVALVVQRNRQAGTAGAGQPAGTAAGGSQPALQVSGPAGAAVGHPSPTVTVPTLAGGAFRLPAGRPAVVYFMAAWCESCQAEAQALGQLHQRVGDRVAVLAVDADPGDLPAQTQAFFRIIGIDVGGPGYQVARDHDGLLVRAFAAQALDTTVVVDPSGRVVYRDAVPTDLATLQAALAKAGLA
jgi:thiol-disulfide isomerase/thioredoxin